MNVEQARKVLATELKERRTGSGRPMSAIFDGTGFNAITDARVTSNRVTVTDNTGKQRIFVYHELPKISVFDNDSVRLAGKSTFWFWSEALTVANALYVLQQNAIKQKKASDEYDAGFTASLADYRKRAASNATLPEEANKYKVQAEGAVRDKAFDDAADFYAEALKIAPWWPVGHFNRALVLGEAGDYEMAKREMNYYLQLVPDAANARAAQNKIYEWERLERSSRMREIKQ